MLNHEFIEEINNMNKNYIRIIVIFVSIFIIGIQSDISHSQEVKNQPTGENVNTDSSLDDIDLDLFIRDIYSKEEFYSPIGKRDPFKPFLKVLDTIRQIDDEIDPLAPPIKRYKLDQFKLVGVFWLENAAQAMIIDPEKNTYMLGIGDEVGRHEGKIIEIRENGISVEEKKHFINADGLRSIKLSKSILAFKE